MGWVKDWMSNGSGAGMGSISDNLGFGGRDQERIKGLHKDISAEQQAQHTDTTGILGHMKDSDTQMMGDLRGQFDTYRGARDSDLQQYYERAGQARKDIQGYMNDANTQYTGDIQPRLKSIMEDAQKEAGSAMTLKDSMDPNNAVATGTRDLYNKQGQAANQRYETQAQGENRQGLADVGMLQAMGAQQMGQQLGAAGVPTTGGQMQALMGQNMSQAGQAMANTQRRVQNLRDQGIGREMDLSDEGLRQGFQRSDIAYDRGQQAKDRYGRSVGAYEDAGGRHRNEQMGYTGAVNRLDQEERDLGLTRSQEDLKGYGGLSGMQHDLDTGGYNRDLAANQQFHSGNIENMNSTLKGVQGDKEQKAKTWEGLMSGGVGMMGKMFSGGKGAENTSGSGTSQDQGGSDISQARGNSVDNANAQAGVNPDAEGGPPPSEEVLSDSDNSMYLAGGNDGGYYQPRQPAAYQQTRGRPTSSSGARRRHPKPGAGARRFR